MHLGRFLLLFLLPLVVCAAEPGQSLRGTLVQREGRPPALQTGAQLVELQGEPDTMKVLEDPRLAGADIEVNGHAQNAAHFAVGPFHIARSLLIHKDGKTYTVSYWCRTCSIRTYTPGKCMCCQQETELSLEEYPPR